MQELSWSEFVKTVRDQWSEMLITLLTFVAGASTFLDTPSTIEHSVSPMVIAVWTAFIIGGALVRLVGHFLPSQLDVITRVGGIGISVGLIVYIVALMFNPNASWFVIVIGLAPFAISIDRRRHDRRIAKANEELRELALKLEKRTYYVDE